MQEAENEQTNDFCKIAPSLTTAPPLSTLKPRNIPAHKWLLRCTNIRRNHNSYTALVSLNNYLRIFGFCSKTRPFDSAISIYGGDCSYQAGLQIYTYSLFVEQLFALQHGPTSSPAVITPRIGRQNTCHRCTLWWPICSFQ